MTTTDVELSQLIPPSTRDYADPDKLQRLSLSPLMFFPAVGASSMQDLNGYYQRILEVGLLVLRLAVDSDDREWASAEIEFLHNIPSLIDEPNFRRHRYFWDVERSHYLEWINSKGSELAKSRMRTFYHPILNEMEPIVSEWLDSIHDDVELQTNRSR